MRSLDFGRNSPSVTPPLCCSSCLSTLEDFAMAHRCLTVGPPNTHGSHSVCRCRHCLHLHATAPRPTCATTSHSLKPLGPALRTNTTQKRVVTSIQKHLHKQLLKRHVTSPMSRAILICLHPTLVPICYNPTAKPTKPKTVVSACPLPGGSYCHPAPPDLSGVVLACPNKRATGQICGKSVDA